MNDLKNPLDAPESSASPEDSTALASALPTTPPTPTSTGFPIVGIGASAGGLAAIEAFFSGLPAHSDPGLAIVLEIGRASCRERVSVLV